MSVSELRALVVQPLDAELEAWPLPDPAIVQIDGDPTPFEGRILWTSDDGCRAIGIERCGPCVMRGVHIDELSHFLEGHVTISPVDGQAFEVRGGQSCFFPKGLETEWTVHETFTKIFHLEADGPLGLEVTGA